MCQGNHPLIQRLHDALNQIQLLLHPGYGLGIVSSLGQVEAKQVEEEPLMFGEVPATSIRSRGAYISLKNSRNRRKSCCLKRSI